MRYFVVVFSAVIFCGLFFLDSLKSYKETRAVKAQLEATQIKYQGALSLINELEDSRGPNHRVQRYYRAGWQGNIYH
jgi:hypothetical protein